MHAMWLAVSCPCIDLDALSVMDVDKPYVIVGKHDSKVVDANAVAQSLGVKTGTSLALAFTLAPSLEVLSKNAKQSTFLLENLAQALVAFSGTVSIRPPDCVVLEVQSMLKFFGSLRIIIQSVERCANDWVSCHHLAIAPTALLAQWRAQANNQFNVKVAVDIDKQVDASISMRDWLDKVPLAATRWDNKQLGRLSGLGLKTLEELYRLPSVSIRKHLGNALYQQFSKAIGTIVDPINAYLVPEQFYREIEFDREVEYSLGLLFPLKNVVQALSVFLCSHRQKLYALTIELTPAWQLDERSSEIRLEVKHDLGSDEAALWLELIEMKLSKLLLPAPIRTMKVTSGQLEASIESNQDLFDLLTHEHQSAALFISRVQARLGDDVVKSPCIKGEHLPERYAEYLPVVAADLIKLPYTPNKKPFMSYRCERPQWLLANPASVDRAQFTILMGPERISTAWWQNQGRLDRRDYYKALWVDQRMAWVYRDDQGCWYLHGWFS